MTSGPPDATSVVRPLLTVVRGQPTPEQIVALVAVVGLRAAEAAAADQPRASRPLWAAPVLRAPLAHGPQAWRASGLPR